MDLFVAGKQCDYTKMRTQDDRKLVRLMWVYDVYFAWSLQQIVEIINNLVQDEKMMQGITRLRNYIQEKLQTKDIWQG